MKLAKIVEPSQSVELYEKARGVLLLSETSRSKQILNKLMIRLVDSYLTIFQQDKA